MPNTPGPVEPVQLSEEEQQKLVNDFKQAYPQLMQPQPVKRARDRAQYVRNQKGHSLTLHLLLGAFVLWIPALYITCSPNHYWHA